MSKGTAPDIWVAKKTRLILNFDYIYIKDCGIWNTSTQSIGCSCWSLMIHLTVYFFFLFLSFFLANSYSFPFPRAVQHTVWLGTQCCMLIHGNNGFTWLYRLWITPSFLSPCFHQRCSVHVWAQIFELNCLPLYWITIITDLILNQ